MPWRGRADPAFDGIHFIVVLQKEADLMNPYFHISRVTCERYKTFQKEVVLELAPLTILFGKNGSGKSVLLRLLPQLAEGISRKTSVGLPLVLPGIDYGSRFPELIYGRLPHGSVKLGMTLNGPNIECDLKWKVQSFLEGHKTQQILADYQVAVNGHEQVRFRWDEDKGDALNPHY